MKAFPRPNPRSRCLVILVLAVLSCRAYTSNLKAGQLQNGRGTPRGARSGIIMNQPTEQLHGSGSASVACTEVIDEQAGTDPGWNTVEQTIDGSKCRLMAYRIESRSGVRLRWSLPNSKLMAQGLFSTNRHSYFVCCQQQM